MRTLATPEPIKDWLLTSLKEKLIKIGAKVVSHGRSHLGFQPVQKMSTIHAGSGFIRGLPAKDYADRSPDRIVSNYRFMLFLLAI